MENTLILVVEDEPDIARILVACLEKDGFRTVTASDGEIALAHAATLKPGLVILDIGLPKLNGFEVLARLRQSSDVAVLMATAMTEDLDKLSALRIGADDYVVKPYNPLEVVARVRAILRRGQQMGERKIQCGALLLDPLGHRITVGLPPISLDLTLSEYRLLAHLMRHPGQVFSRMDLIDACMPDSGALERTIDSHIAHLRQKLKTTSAEGHLTSVRGVGYKLEATK